MKSKRYEGEFRSIDGTLWRVELWQETTTAYPNPLPLSFPWDEPLLITWEGVEKHKAIEKSRAELIIVSPGDRTYMDLYSVKGAQVRMDVYRSDVLYWSGTLDPEQYSEPFEEANGYDVKLTFGDFGVLDRIRHQGSGLQSLADIVNGAVDAAGLLASVDWSLTGTRVDADPVEEATAVDSSNWVDDNGTHDTWLEVLEGVLEPLALRMRQRNGRVWLYSIHGLHTSAEAARNRGIYPPEIYWTGTEQTLDADVVYNNVKVSWSTNCQAGDLLPTDLWGRPKADPTKKSITFEGLIDPATGARYQTVPVYEEDETALTEAAFTLWTRDAHDDDPVIIESPTAKVGTIVAQNEGSDHDCVAVMWTSFQYTATGGATGYWRRQVNGISAMDLVRGRNMFYYGLQVEDAHPIFRTKPVHLVQSSEPLVLNVTIPLLLREGVLPAPFNEHKLSHPLMNRCYMPVRVCFKPDGSEDVQVWSNRDVLLSHPLRGQTRWQLSHSLGEWAPKEGDKVQGWLEYYADNAYDEDLKKNKEHAFARGFADNRPAFGTKCHIAAGVARSMNGQPMPYPATTTGGELWVEVLDRGWDMSGDTDSSDIGEYFKSRFGNFPSKSEAEIMALSETDIEFYFFRIQGWILVGMPQVEVRRAGAVMAEIDTDDIVFDMALNPQAKEELTIDARCGSAATEVPMARGAYLSTSTGMQLHTFSRAGYDGTSVELLGNTLFSHYGERCIKIRGEARCNYGDLEAVVEANSGNTLYMLSSEIQDVHNGWGEVLISEIRPDEYEPDTL